MNESRSLLTCRPYIAFFGIFLFVNFRSHVDFCSNWGSHSQKDCFAPCLIRSNKIGGEAKVNQFDIVRIHALENEIFRFNISVADIHLVDVRNGFEYLFKNWPSIIFIVKFSLGHFLIELEPAQVFFNKKDMVLVFIVLYQLYDVWMVKLLQSFEFLEKVFLIVLVENFFLKAFDCANRTWRSVDGLVNFAIASLSNFFLDVIEIWDSLIINFKNGFLLIYPQLFQTLL